jgi:hypothetical protein
MIVPLETASYILVLSFPLSRVDSGASSEEQFKGFKPYSHDAAPLRPPLRCARRRSSVGCAGIGARDPARARAALCNRERGGGAFQRG